MRLMLMSDSPNMNTGYGQTSMYMLNELEALGWDVAAIGFGIAGAPMRFEGLEIWPGGTPQMLQKSLAKFKPDILLHMRDNWVFIPKYNPSPYSLIGMCHEMGIHMVNFTPVQATPLPPEFIECISTQADFTYITNQTGVDACIEQGAPKDRIGLMYNGIDMTKFRQMKVQREQTNLPKDKKMVMFVGANMDYRKQIPVTMKAFRNYLDKYGDNAFLYLHTNPYGGFDIPLFIDLLKLQKSCFLKSASGVKLNTWDLSANEMAVLFNLADSYVTCTAAEGFNQPALEAIACGLPIAITDTQIHRELFSRFGDRVRFIKARQTLPTVWAFEHNCDPDDAADAIAEGLAYGKKEIDMHQFNEFSYRRIMRKFAEEAPGIVDRALPDPKAEKEILEKAQKEAAEKLKAVRNQA